MYQDMSQETYRQQVSRLVQALAAANCEAELAADLANPSTPDRVKMFVDDNLTKRYDKLRNQLEFVRGALEGFEDLTVQYIRAVPLAAYDTGASDGQRMLQWIKRTQPLTPVQQDYVTCQAARLAIEDLARTQRLKYVHFHQLYESSSRWLGQLAIDPHLCIHLNPIRTWTCFVSGELLDEETTPPANVLFFAVGGEIATAVLELEGQALINELADYAPCTLAEWAAWSQLADHQQLVELCHDLVEMGLVAVEEES